MPVYGDTPIGNRVVRYVFQYNEVDDARYVADCAVKGGYCTVSIGGDRSVTTALKSRTAFAKRSGYTDRRVIDCIPTGNNSYDFRRGMLADCDRAVFSI